MFPQRRAHVSATVVFVGTWVAAPRGPWRRLAPHAWIYYVTKNIFKRIYRHKHLHVHKYSSQPISQPCVERREDLLSRTLSAEKPRQAGGRPAGGGRRKGGRGRDLVDCLMWKFVFHIGISHEIITYLNCYQEAEVKPLLIQTGARWWWCLQLLAHPSPLA